MKRLVLILAVFLSLLAMSAVVQASPGEPTPIVVMGAGR